MSEIKSPSFPFLTWIKALRGNYVHKDIGNFDKNNWMSRLDGEKYISDISVPGTHDTCALYEPLRELAKCQMYTVTDQLNMGVRYPSECCQRGSCNLPRPDLSGNHI